MSDSAKKKTTANQGINTANFIPSILLICFLCLGFVPNWSAVDKIAPQWLLMGVLNLVSILYILYYRRTFENRIFNTLRSLQSILYIGFILWAGLSYFYAINPIEVLINITRQFNTLLMYIHMGIFIYALQSKMKMVSYIIVLILFIEAYAVLQQAWEMFNNSGKIIPYELKGVAANRNITAFSLAIKIPFVLFLIYISKKNTLKIVFSTLIFMTLLGLSMISSRGSFLGVGLILVAFIGLNIKLYLVDKKKNHLYRMGYYIIPLLLAIVLNQTVLTGKGNVDAIARASTISLSTNDGSVNQRLRYYADVVTHLKGNPIFGTGLGNWKLKSIDYDKEDVKGYVVPYHAHSDFIQLGAELGIVGFLLYLGVFVMAVFYCWKLLSNPSLQLEEKVFVFLLLTALGVYGIDANLNFPIARPQVLVVWAVSMALINFYYKREEGEKTKKYPTQKIGIIFGVLSVLLLIPCIYIFNKVYESQKGQLYLLHDFNTRKYSIPLEKVDNIVPSIPNITVTTIPIKSIKARYYANGKKYEKALQLLNEGTKDNPYLYYSEVLKSQIFLAQNKLDSAYVNARKAFFNLPGNGLHATTYIKVLSIRKDLEGFKEAFPYLTKRNNKELWKQYLLECLKLQKSVDDTLAKQAKKATELFPDDVAFKQIHKIMALGNQRIQDGNGFSKEALKFFNRKDYKNAVLNFEKAIEADPLEYSYYEKRCFILLFSWRKFRKCVALH